MSEREHSSCCTSDGGREAPAIRYFAASASGATAMMHFLIGFGVLSVLKGSKDIRL